MEDFNIEKPRITKLSGPNYRPWSVQVQRLLAAQYLWNVVLWGPKGTKEPEQTAITPEEEAKDAKASTLIMGYCAQGTLQHILLLETAKEQWDALKALYQPLGLQQLGTKLKAFTSYTPPKDSTSTITTIATDLTTLQAEIGDIDPKERPSENAKIAVFLRAVRALDPRFDPLILQLEISGTVTDYTIVVTKLTEFERRMGPREPIITTAYRAKEREASKDIGDLGDSGDSGDEEPQIRCYKCGGIGHKRSECPTKKPVRGRARESGGRARESVIRTLWPQELEEPQVEGALTAW
jgi:hypothetical protein